MPKLDERTEQAVADREAAGLVERFAEAWSRRTRTLSRHSFTPMST